MDLEGHRKKTELLRALREQLAEAIGSYGSTLAGAGSGVKTSPANGNPAVERCVDRKLHLEERIAALETEIESEWQAWEPELEAKLTPEELNIITFCYHRGWSVKRLTRRRQRKHGGEWATCMNTVCVTRRRALEKLK